LANQKVIAHARIIMKDQLGISEQEAHRDLLRQAMQERVTVIDLAKRIIANQKQKNGAD